MRLNAGKILGISITKDAKEKILEYIQKYLDSDRKKPLVIVTPNAEQLVLAKENKRFADILNRADIAIPDGFPVALLLGCTRIPGVEFMEDLVAVGSKRGYRIGLIGGRGDLALKTLECLSRKYPGLSGKVGTIRDADIVFVALGAPKQEFYIEEESKKWKGKLFMAVGGSFDILSGRIPRAPFFIRSIGFEWAWRLIREPWRWRRQRALVQFVFLVLKEKILSL